MHWHSIKLLSGGFGAEDALEAGAGKVHTDDVFAGAGGGGYVNNTALRGKIGAAAARGVMMGNKNFDVGADGYVEAGDEGRAAAAQIFTGGFFFKVEAATVASADFQRQAHGDPTF